MLNSNLFVRSGDSRITAVSGGAAGTTELFVATGPTSGSAWTAAVTRAVGATLQFVEDNTLGGGANIRYPATNQVSGTGRIGSWATYGTNYNGGAFTWAATDA